MPLPEFDAPHGRITDPIRPGQPANGHACTLSGGPGNGPPSDVRQPGEPTPKAEHIAWARFLAPSCNHAKALPQGVGEIAAGSSGSDL
jgi:hypothetical protein